MPVKSGKVSSVHWRMLRESLQRLNHNDSRCKAFKDPGVGPALSRAYGHGTRGEVYALKAPKRTYYLVFSANLGKPGRKLVYPKELPVEVENAMLLNALIASQCSPIGLAWKREGSLMYLVAIPLLGLLWTWLFGYQIPMVSTHAPDTGILVTKIIGAAGLTIILFPFAQSWYRMLRLRQALDDYSLGRLTAYLRNLRKSAYAAA